MIGLPLVPFIYSRIDPFVVMLAVWGLALAHRGRQPAGGGTLALAALTKLWPLVVAPALLIEHRTRVARWFASSFAVSVVAWVAYGGVDAIRQVVSFRGVTGWEFESTIGSIVWLPTGGPSDRRVELLTSGRSQAGAACSWCSCS